MLEELMHDPEPGLTWDEIDEEEKAARAKAITDAAPEPEKVTAEMMNALVREELIPDDEAAVEAKTPRKTRYRVKLHLDGASEVTVTIERGTTHQLVTVRPLGKRGTYTISLANVAEMIAYRVAKNQAEELRLEKAAGNRAKKFQRRRR